jgi:hypothetical protein
MSSSHKEGFGAMMLTYPDDTEEFAVILAHEAVHSVLSALMHAVSLLNDSGAAVYYSPWRNDRRPIGGLLHGAYSYMRIVEFWRSRRGSGLEHVSARANFEFALWRACTRDTIRFLLAEPAVTELGRRFLGVMAAQLEPWTQESVPDPVESVALDVASDRRALWRLRHLQPVPSEVTRLAEAWAARHPAVGAAVACRARTGVDTTNEHGRGALARIRFGDPELFSALRENAASVGKHVPGTAEPDVAWVAGERERAAHGYASHLDAAPDDLSAWVGLALCQSDDPVRRFLLDRPELVWAVQCEIHRTTGTMPGMAPLARWMIRR